MIKGDADMFEKVNECENRNSKFRSIIIQLVYLIVMLAF